jgi:hypothetical protein
MLFSLFYAAFQFTDIFFRRGYPAPLFPNSFF